MQDEALHDLYQAVILDHARNPRNRRRPEPCSHEAAGDNPLCGDRVTVYLRLTDVGQIEEAGFDAEGCAIAVASASLMTEVLRGASEAAARRLVVAIEALCAGRELTDPGEDRESLDRLCALSGVRAFPMRVKCVTLAWQTMLSALEGTDRGSISQ
jgi:nitrogen fixation NifU-like protein